MGASVDASGPGAAARFNAPPSAELATWVENLFLAEASDAETLGLLRASQRLIGWATARQVDAVVELCARRVRSAEHAVRLALAAGDVLESGAASRRLDLTERAVTDEIALGLGCTRWLADRLVATSLALTNDFPATLDALRAGRLDPRKAEAITLGLAELDDPVLRGRAEALALEIASEVNVPTLRERIRQAVLRVRPVETEEAAAGGRNRRRVVFSPADDDMMELLALMPADDGARVRAALDRAADRARSPGDPRSADRRRLDTIVDAITGLEAVADWPTDAASGARGGHAGAEAGVEARADAVPDVASDVGPANTAAIEASSVRRGRRRISGPRVEVVLTVPLRTVTGDADSPGHLSGYGPVSAAPARQMAWDVAAEGIWRCAVVDDQSGTLLGLGISTVTPAFEATAASGRHVLTRDQVCGFPGCRGRAVRCDSDHSAMAGRAEL